MSRLPEPFLQSPPAKSWGALYRYGLRDKGFYLRLGRLMGRELAAAGINMNFVPVLDVDSNPKNPIIGDRAFSDQPDEVIQTALPFARGLLASGVIPCGKHFPGHGDTTTDSHLTLPHVNRTLSRLQKIELPPFQAAIEAEIPMLMTAHVVYRALDPKNPATFSSTILQRLLRQKMRFRGVIVSDDLQMKAVARDRSLLETTYLALEAGVDLLMVCKEYESLTETIEKLAGLVQKSPALEKKMLGSLSRIRRLRRQLK